MATIDVTISTYIEPGFSFFTVSPASITLARGDIIRFTYSTGGTNPVAVTVFGLTSDRFSPFSNQSFSADGQQRSVTVTGTATLGTANVGVAASGFVNKNLPVEITSGIDNTPDNFSFITISGQPNEQLVSNTIRITGINAGTSISSTGGQFSINNSGSFVSGGTVYNGDYVTLRQNTPNAYNSAATMTVTVGTVARTWRVETYADPGEGETIPFPVTSGSAITLKQVLDFFGGDPVFLNPSRPNNMRAYFKGGAYVPNITKNANIPTSGTLRLSNFVGSGTALYYLKRPGYKSAYRNTIGSGGTLSVVWDFTSDTAGNPKIGFGPVAFSCQYRYRVTQTTGPGVTVSSGAVNTWSAWSTNTLVSVSYVAPTNSEAEITGMIEMEVRSTYATSIVLYAAAPFNLYAYGP